MNPEEENSTMKLSCLVCLVLLVCQTAFAQVEDNFSDKNHTLHPVWYGDTGKFVISNEEKLQLDAPAESGSAYLSTSSQAIADAVWQCLVEISENPSSTNYAKFYLTANNAALDNSLEGYFVKVGGSTDEVSLYRQDGTQETKIIDGTDDRVNTSPVSINIKVVRDMSGNWELLTKTAEEQAFVSEGSVQDITYTASTYIGVYCQYTSTRSTAFSFDDFIVTGSLQPDLIAPHIAAQSVISSKQVTLTFSEAVAQEAAEQSVHYQINEQAPASAILAAEDSVVLTFSQEFVNADTLLLHVQSITDVAGNAIADTTISMFYFQEVAAQFRDVVVNEVLSDPNPQVDSLPADTNAEFIELYNRSEHPFNLHHWQLNGKTLPETILLPGTYLILCRLEYVDDYQPYGNTVSVSSWPSLNNSGGQLILANAEGMVIDSMSYENDLVEGGVSIEQINPDKACGFSNNYTLSTDSNGATPGRINSTFDDTPDTQGPQLLETHIVSTDTMLLYFDEPVYTEEPDISIVPTLPVKVWQLDKQSSVLQIITEKPLVSEVNYTISIANLSDCQGNTRGEQVSAFYFDTTPPAIEQLLWLDTASLFIGFHEKIEKTSASKPENYTLLPDSLQPKKVSFHEDSTSVLLTFARKLCSEQNYQLQLVNIADLSGNPHASLTHSFRLKDAIDTVMVVSDYQLDVVFNTSLLESTAQNPDHYKLNNAVVPRAAILHQSDSRLLHLMFDTPIAANKTHTLRVSNLQDTAGNTLQTPARHFYHDTKAPKVEEIIVTDAIHLKAVFNEKIDTDLSDVALSIEGIDIMSAKPGADHLSILIALQDSLQQQETYKLMIAGIKDLYGNQLTDQQTVSFVYDTEPPKIIAWQLLSPTLLKLTFHEALSDTSATATANYLLQHTEYPTSAVHAQTDPAIVFLDFGTIIPDEASLSVQHIADLQGNILQDTLHIAVANHALAIGAVHSLSAHTVKVTFTKEILAEKLLPAQFVLNDSIVASNISGLPDDFSSIILSFDTPLSAENTLKIRTDARIIHEPMRVNFAYSTKVTNLAQNAPSSLNITFAVPVKLPEDAVSYFSVTEKEHPAAVVQTDAFTFHLLFDENFQAQQMYTLDIKSFADAEYGYIPSSSHTFGSGISPERYELLITEIMADPSPVAGLPEAEYIELYNPTDNIIDLSGITLNDEQAKATFPPAVLMPKSYVIISSKTDAIFFSPMNPTIGLNSFPSLNSEGDILTLRNAEGALIFAVAYSDAWYNDAERKNGGWSLEMIDTHRPCGEIENWTAATDPRGGTPGEANSVQTYNPDHQSPRMQNILVTGGRTLLITFNEKIDPASVRTDYFQLSEGLQVQSLEILSEKEVLLELHQDIPTGTEISIQARSLTDCAGNSITDDQPLTFARPKKAEKGDIVLSELLFNPRAGGVPFVELYNHSDKYINLQYWQLANVKDETTVEAHFITEKPLILPPHQYIALTVDSKILKADYSSAIEEYLYTVQKLPLLYVSEGTIQLLNAESRLMESFHYDERMHHPLVEEPKGVSLEKISWDTTANHEDRWQSAAGSVGFATPGYQNSQMMRKIASPLMLSAEPKIFSPYQSIQPYTTIHYQMQEAGSVATLSIFNARGKRVRVLLDQQTLAQEGWITWDGTDHNLQPLPIGHYIILMQVYDLKGNVSTHKTKVVVASPF